MPRYLSRGMLPREGPVMTYALLANPKSGPLAPAAREAALARAAAILRAEVHGLDTTSREEFQARARELAERCDVLAVAGGDGTLSDVINAVDTRSVTLAYLPLGSGNAMAYALGLRAPVERAAQRVRDGRSRRVDLVECEGGLRGFMVSLGFDGEVMHRRHAEPARYRGLAGYARSCGRELAGGLRGWGAELRDEGGATRRGPLFSLAVVKQPYFGYGLRWVPGARLDDGLLHVRWLRPGLAAPLAGLATGFTIGNRAGRTWTTPALEVSLDRPAWLQCDGNVAWRASRFAFRVLPEAWTIRA